MRQHVKKLSQTAAEKLKSINGLQIIGSPHPQSGIVSFHLPNIHPHDMATFLAVENIAVRAGRHCAQPLMGFLKLPGTVRASFAVYNTLEEVEGLVEGVREAVVFFG